MHFCSSSKSSGTQQRGVTLIELLVGLAVGLLVTGLLLSAHLQTTKVWTQSEVRTARARQLEVVTEVLAADLSRLVSFSGVASLSTAPLQDATAPGLDPGSGQLHFLSAIENNGLTEVCGVSYRCQWDAAIGGYALYRYVIESDELHNRLSGIQASEEASLMEPSPLYHLIDRQIGEGERVAAYVWNFQPTILLRNNQPQPASSTLFDGSMPQAVRTAFFVAPVTAKLEHRVNTLERAYWNLPASHFFEQTFDQFVSEAVREFPLPRGWTPPEPDPNQPPEKSAR